MTRWTLCYLVVGLGAFVAEAQTTLSTTSPSPQMRQITIVEVEGLVQARVAVDQPWMKATVGMVVPGGGNIRLGPKSRAVITEAGGDPIVLDRLGHYVVDSLFEPARQASTPRTRFPSTEPTLIRPSSTLVVRSGPPIFYLPTTRPTTRPK